MLRVACSSTSAPVRSVVASGPIGRRKPGWHAVPRSSGEPTALPTSFTASTTRAQINRVVTKPATSRLTVMVVLPIPSANAFAVARVASEVLYPRTSSQSFIIGTGEKKWVPTTDSGRWVATAIWVTGMALVLVASTADSLQILSSARNTSCFTSRRSNTASTTMSALATSSRSVVVRIRWIATAATSGSSVPLRTCRPSESRMLSSPRLSASLVRSRRVTSQPAWAATCAIPAPISPAPTTASRPAIPALLSSTYLNGNLARSEGERRLLGSYVTFHDDAEAAQVGDEVGVPAVDVVHVADLGDAVGPRADQLAQRVVQMPGPHTPYGPLPARHGRRERPGTPDDPVPDRTVCHRLQLADALDEQPGGTRPGDPRAHRGQHVADV